MQEEISALHNRFDDIKTKGLDEATKEDLRSTVAALKVQQAEMSRITKEAKLAAQQAEENVEQLKNDAANTVETLKKEAAAFGTPIDAVSKAEFLKLHDARRKQVHLSNNDKLLVYGLPTDWSADKRSREIIDALKTLPANDSPEARDITHAKTRAGAWPPIASVTFETWGIRKNATPPINALAGRGARVVFDSGTDRFNRMVIAAASDITKTMWGSPPPSKAEQRARVQILFREDAVKVGGVTVLERTGPEGFKWTKYEAGDSSKKATQM